MNRSTESEASSLKRQLARALREVEELKHASERSKLESNLAFEKAQAQLLDSASRIEKLERHRAVLIAKERERTEREQSRIGEIDDGKSLLEEELRTVKKQLSTLQEQHIDLEEGFKDLEHAAKKAVRDANSEKQASKALREELDVTREEVDNKIKEALDEKRKRLTIEAELEQEKLRGKESAGTELIREELHRRLFLPLIVSDSVSDCYRALLLPGQVSHLKALEKENGKLKRKVETYERQHSNVEVLKEANRSLENKLKGLEELRRELSAQALEIDSLKREKNEW